MQRVRIGLTGLAFVFIAVLLAAAFIRRPISESPITTNAQAKAAAESAEKGSPQQEPLAELGVAPGNAGNSNAGNSAATPQP